MFQDTAPERATTFLLVQPDGSIEERTEPLTVSAVQDILGGDFEQMPSGSGVSVFSKSDISSDDTFNWSITRLIQNHLMPTDRVFGPVIVFGEANAIGDPTDVPEKTKAILTEWYEHRQ